jgi:hypothetical protein
MAGGSAPMKAWPTEQSIKQYYPSTHSLAQAKGDEEKKEEAKPEEKKEEKKDAKEEIKEPESKESKEEKEVAKKEDDKKKTEAEEEKKEAEKKNLKVDNAADRNQQVADNARKEAFDAVVSQESGEKDLTDDIAASHAKAAADAGKSEVDNVAAYDQQRRGMAPKARDSLRFVDTENEGLNGVKYGDRASLA